MEALTTIINYVATTCNVKPKQVRISFEVEGWTVEVTLHRKRKYQRDLVARGFSQSNLEKAAARAVDDVAAWRCTEIDVL